eukprot:TRINITY_DN9081_c0_g1_i1.p1 TRINITY_DN9081_c0_g1~~TRINITY_DN9081_c0_g1_i1.p1  ORF type:complete len:184 (-),score=31.94 TRINITY_DN9081_c0_g1_i1:228-734(-)
MPNSYGRWGSPTQNADSFLSQSPLASCCQTASGRSHWGGQGEDITTAIEKMEKHRKTFSNTIGESTVSSPASMWRNPNLNCFKFGSSSHQSGSSSSQNGSIKSFTSNSQNPWLNSSRNSFSQPVFSNLSSNSARTSVTSSDQLNPFSSSSSRFSSSSSYENDRLMQMD